MSMKPIICVFLFLISFIASGQKISFNQEILSATDPEIIAVRELWKAYVNDCFKGSETDKDSIPLKYWNSIELEQGFTDVAKDEFPIYSLGELVTFDIKKEKNGFYRIRSMVLFTESTGKSVYAIFNIYAKKDKSEYKLYNQFFLTKSKLQHFHAGNIDFYCPVNYNFTIEKAKETADSYSKFSTLYGNPEKRKITYIIGNTFDEANSFIGFDFSVVSSTSPFAGYSIRSKNIVLSCREDHLHEIIHAVFFSMFPNEPALFSEGVATYYGGTGGQNYSYLISQLRNLINNKPDIDLSKFDNFDKTLDNGTNHFYNIGAIFIDYALKIGGLKKVLALFQYSVTNPLTWDDPISAIKKELGIEKNQIDAFLKKYIQNYKGN